MAQKPENVLVVINDSSALSRSAGEYYARKRSIPIANVCRIKASSDELIEREEYDRHIARPIAACLTSRNLRESVNYIVTTSGVPLIVNGKTGMDGDIAAVDSELALLYTDMRTGKPHRAPGMIPNPMFGKVDHPFTHAEFPIYLVTRLAGYDFADIRGLIDRSLEARNRGKFIFDLKENGAEPGDSWMREAASLLPSDRVLLDTSTDPVYDQKDVIGYAGWGSNDKSRHRRNLGYQWLPGAIDSEFVSTNARTFERPPAKWNIGGWDDPKADFHGSPQTMIGDAIQEGVTGVSGHVSEPYLNMTPRPEYLFPAYFKGRTLAESFYLSIPMLSWENVMIGDPLCVLQ